jgi:hypothetical protein
MTGIMARLKSIRPSLTPRESRVLLAMTSLGYPGQPFSSTRIPEKHPAYGYGVPNLTLAATILEDDEKYKLLQQNADRARDLLESSREDGRTPSERTRGANSGSGSSWRPTGVPSLLAVH